MDIPYQNYIVNIGTLNISTKSNITVSGPGTVVNYGKIAFNDKTIILDGEINLISCDGSLTFAQNGSIFFKNQGGVYLNGTIYFDNIVNKDPTYALLSNYSTRGNFKASLKMGNQSLSICWFDGSQNTGDGYIKTSTNLSYTCGSYNTDTLYPFCPNWDISTITAIIRSIIYNISLTLPISSIPTPKPTPTPTTTPIPNPTPTPSPTPSPTLNARTPTPTPTPTQTESCGQISGSTAYCDQNTNVTVINETVSLNNFDIISFTDGRFTVNGNITTNSSEIKITTATVINIQGSLVLNSSTLKVQGNTPSSLSSPLIQTSGCIEIHNSSLNIDNINSNATNITIVQSPCVTGEFTSVTINGLTGSCKKSSIDYKPTFVSLLLTTNGCEETTENQSQQQDIILGASIGSVAFVFVVVSIVILTVPKFRRAVFPYRDRYPKSSQ
eukprot:TRINITY_DN2379_c0_g1_i3.p1 TRINITY_DN2379_c0_g1~~TRINITY_DN2379_c0_g1_i3.p1  ORF type:complete len:441 (-),score=76.37 TRINITY_DN2379_c0_g1_i3:108-1430(-)